MEPNSLNRQTTPITPKQDRDPAREEVDNQRAQKTVYTEYQNHANEAEAFWELGQLYKCLDTRQRALLQDFLSS
tara:strand:- start:35473 stop:35694 length:222 start_codon:yes stop_codon:yes gene_type:complete